MLKMFSKRDARIFSLINFSVAHVSANFSFVENKGRERDHKPFPSFNLIISQEYKSFHTIHLKNYYILHKMQV